jgi:hypothetical protein
VTGQISSAWNWIRVCEEMRMTTQADIESKERDLVVKCIGEAYEALHLMPGVDANGPVLVWLADQFVQIQRRADQAS